MRLIDADKLIEVLNKKSVPFNANVNDAILTAPTVDAVEVVRCKDCKHMKYAIDKGKNGMCGVHSALIIMNGNDYCSYGEREEE